nr:immunoglobulin heavy chain junction region [Mus musculus]
CARESGNPFFFAMDYW